MAQILFLMGLYGFGVFFGLLFKKQLPSAFLGITGYLWGALIWVAGGVLLNVLTIPYSPVSITILFFLLGIGIAFLHIRQKTWQLSRSELLWILSFAFAFLVILVLASQFNFSVASPDSAIMISAGRRVAHGSFSDEIIGELSLRGVFLPQLMSAAVFLGDGYLYAAQPAFAFTFFALYFYLSKRVLGHLVTEKRLALILSVLSSLVLFSTYFIVFQFFYIHTNLISAAYLFLAVSAFWLAAVEGKDAWMTLGMLGLLGFSLARTEAPVFALPFLVLVISSGKIPYRIRLRTMLPYSFSLVAWYLYLLARMGEGTYILNRERTLVIIVSLIALALLVILSELKSIKRYLLPHLPKIMLGVLVLALLLMVIHKPEHYRISVYALILNMLESGEWGMTWLVYWFLFVVSQAGPRFPQEDLFLYGVILFFALLLAIVYFRVPYRVGWGDSANRIWTHILPITILYVLMKTTYGQTANNSSEKGKISN